MSWLAAAWRRVARAVRVRARLVSRLRWYRRANRLLRLHVAEVLTVADRERTRLMLAHAEELAERQQVIAELRRVLAGEEARAADAEERVRRELSNANTAWHRIGGVWRVVDDESTPPDVAARLRRVLDDRNYKPTGVDVDA